MQQFQVCEKPVRLHTGMVQLTARQAAVRSTHLEATEDPDVFKILAPIELKIGEIFGYDGEMPKSLAVCLEKIVEDAETLAGVLLSELKNFLGFSIPETVKLLKEKYNTAVQNKGAALVPQDIADQVMANEKPAVPAPNPAPAPAPDAGLTPALPKQ